MNIIDKYSFWLYYFHNEGHEAQKIPSLKKISPVPQCKFQYFNPQESTIKQSIDLDNFILRKSKD